MARGCGGVWARIAALSTAVVLLAVGAWIMAAPISAGSVAASEPSPTLAAPQAGQPSSQAAVTGACAPADVRKVEGAKSAKPAPPVVLVSGSAHPQGQPVRIVPIAPNGSPTSKPSAKPSAEVLRTPRETQTMRGLAPVSVSGHRAATATGNPEVSAEVGSAGEPPSEPVTIDLPPVQGLKVNVSELPVETVMPGPKAPTNRGEDEYQEERAKRNAGAGVTDAQNGLAPDAPASTLVPGAALSITESTPGSGTPSFRDYTAPAGGGGPPDVDMAAGLSYIITDYNSFFRIYDKSGVKQGSDHSFPTFFSGLTNCGNGANNICDPQMVYDDQNDRFVFTCLAVTSTTSYICIAATQTGDPRGTWNKYEIDPQATSVHDYPHTAIGEDAIFVSMNNFTMAGAYQQTALVAVQKSNAYAGTALTPRYSTLSTTYYNARPVVRRGYNQSQYPPAGTGHFFIIGDGSDNAVLFKWAMPTFSSTPAVVATWSDTYPGTSVNPSEAAYTNLQMDSLSTKIMDAEVRWPYMWFVRTGLNTGVSPNRDVVRWGEVNLSTTPPTTVQSGTYGLTNQHVWLPDCTVDKNNSMAVVMTAAGITPTVLVGSYITGHDSAGGSPTPTGQLETIQASKAGEVVYTGTTQNGAYRWGDYQGCQIDPNGCDIWVCGEYSANLATAQKEATWVQKWSFADCVVSTCTYQATMSALQYGLHVPITATILNVESGSCPVVAPSNAQYHTTTGGALPATISGTAPNFTVSAVTSDQLGAADGDDVWLTYTASDGSTVTSPHSKIDGSLNVCTTSVDPLGGGCDGDIYMDQNETLNVDVLMANSEAFDLPTGFLADLVVDPAHPDANITIVNGTTQWDPIPAGGTAYASGTPFQVRYTAAGGGPHLCYFKVQNIRATDSSWAGNGACAANSFTEYANTNETAGTTLVNEGFNATTLPTGWQNTQVTGTGLWKFAASITHPTMTPHAGADMAWWNSYTYAAGTQARLATPVISLAGTTLPKVTFWMTHDTTWTNDDTIAVVVSTDSGSTWSAPLATFHRRTGGTVAGVWLQHSVDLSAYIGQTTVRVGFLATSAYGDNMGFDDVWVGNVNRVNDPNNCTTALPDITYSDGDWMFDDATCNNLSDWANWVPSPDAGESGSLLVYLGNDGNEDAYNVQGTLTCPSCPAGVQICSTNPISYGTIPYGTGFVYGPGNNGFRIALPTGMTSGADLPFVLNLTTTNSGYTPPVFNLVSTPHDPYNTRGGTATIQGSCASNYSGNGTAVSTDAFSTLPSNTGTTGRCGPGWSTTGWTIVGTVTADATQATPSGDTRSAKIRTNGASIARMFDTTGIDADVRIHTYLDLTGATSSTLSVDYTSNGGTNWYSIASGAGGATASAWADFGGSIYWSIYGGTGTGFGPAAANAIFNNPNFGIRFSVTGGTGAATYDYVDDIEVEMYKFVNQTTSCTGACAAPDAPVINLGVDVNACVMNGIKIYYDGSLGSSSYDLMKDGSLAVTGYVSGATYSPGDTSSHNYTIRANNSNGSTQSAPYAFTDASSSWTPTITGGSGPGNTLLTTESGWSSYQWYKDGVAIGGATSNTYTASAPADCGSHNYTVSYKAGACSSTNLSAAHNVNITTGCGAPVPPKVPYSVTPTKMTTANHGTDGSVSWDAVNCTSTNYHIIYGKGENLAAWTVDGGKCTIGTSGTYTWNGVPDPSTYTSRFLWWLIVGDNGGTTEGSWGLTYPGGAQEGGATASGVCGITTKDTSGSCGTP